MSYHSYDHDQGRLGTERERVRKTEWRLEKEKKNAKDVHVFISLAAIAVIAYGYYGPLFTPLPVLSPQSTSWNNSGYEKKKKKRKSQEQ